MTEEAFEYREFFDKCPAWARKAGVSSLLQWQFIEFLMPFSKEQRFDQLDEFRSVAIAVLAYWDAMSEKGQDI